MTRTKAQVQKVRHRIRESERAEKKCKKPIKRWRHDVENGGDMGGKRENLRRGRVGLVATDPYNV